MTDSDKQERHKARTYGNDHTRAGKRTHAKKTRRKAKMALKGVR